MPSTPVFWGSVSMHGACLQTSVLILYDLKRSPPDGACEVCRVRWCAIPQLQTYTWNGSLLILQHFSFMLVNFVYFRILIISIRVT
jgi:hypothetical protein